MELFDNATFTKNNRDNYWMLNWLDEYMDGHKGFIAGGCFKNIFQKEKVKDLDIFFESQSDWDEAVEYFDSMTEGYGFDDDKVTRENAEYRFLYENSKVKAYKNIKTGVQIELCCAIFGNPEKVLSSFDFTITKFAYYKEEVEDTGEDAVGDSNGNVRTHIEYKILHHKDFFEHLHLNRLVTDSKIPFPMSTFERMIRYIGYGYKPCKETKVKIAKAIHDLNTEEIEANNSLYNGMD